MSQVFIDSHLVIVRIVIVSEVCLGELLVEQLASEVFPEGDAHLVVRDPIFNQVPNVRILPRTFFLPSGDELG